MFHVFCGFILTFLLCLKSLTGCNQGLSLQLYTDNYPKEIQYRIERINNSDFSFAQVTKGVPSLQNSIEISECVEIINSSQLYYSTRNKVKCCCNYHDPIGT